MIAALANVTRPHFGREISTRLEGYGHDRDGVLSA